MNNTVKDTATAIDAWVLTHAEEGGIAIGVLALLAYQPELFSCTTVKYPEGAGTRDEANSEPICITPETWKIVSDLEKNIFNSNQDEIALNAFETLEAQVKPLLGDAAYSYFEAFQA